MLPTDDHSALNAFLAGVEHRALRMAQYATRDRDEAFDIVQEAMIRLCERYAHRPSDEWPPLFFRILERRILDWHRRSAVRRRLFVWRRRDDEAAPGPHDDARDEGPSTQGAPSPEDEIVADHTLAAVNEVLESLPVRQQQVFLLRVWQGLDVRETAAAMGCSEGSVKTHLSRAMARVRAAIGETS